MSSVTMGQVCLYMKACEILHIRTSASYVIDTRVDILSAILEGKAEFAMNLHILLHPSFCIEN